MEPTEGNFNEPLYRDPKPPSGPSKNTKRAVLITLGSFLLLLVCNAILNPNSTIGRPTHPLDHSACGAVPAYQVEANMSVVQTLRYVGNTRKQATERGALYNVDASCQTAIVDYEWSLRPRP